MRSGWVKLPRALLEREWMRDARMAQLYIYLLLSCNTEATTFRGATISAGEVAISRRPLARRLGMSEMELRGALARLEAAGEIATRGAWQCTIVAIRADADLTTHKTTHKIPSEAIEFKSGCEDASNKNNTQNNTHYKEKEYKRREKENIKRKRCRYVIRNENRAIRIERRTV